MIQAIIQFYSCKMQIWQIYIGQKELIQVKFIFLAYIIDVLVQDGGIEKGKYKGLCFTTQKELDVYNIINDMTMRS